MDLTAIYRRFLRNAGLVVGSRVVFGLLNLATTVLVVRAFGLAELGAVLLLQSYARLFSEVVKFQSWQAVLRFGALLEDRGDRAGFRRLIGFTLTLDLVSFAVAIGAAIAMIPWVRVWFDWPDAVAAFAPVYLLSIVFITHATPNGILRLFDRVDLIALQFASNAVLRLAGVGVAVLLGGGVEHLVMAWFAASVLSGSAVIAGAVRELWRRGLAPRLRTGWGAAAREFPGIWRYLWLANLTSVAGLVVNYATVLVVGAQLGAAAAATFDIARQVSSAIARPARLLGPLLFPEFSRLAARGDWLVLRRIMTRVLGVTALVLTGIGAALFAVLPELVALLFGAELLDAIWLFRLLLAGAMIRMLGFALEPAFLSANKAGTSLLIQFAATGVYVAIAAPGLGPLGLTAIGVGMLGFNITHLVLFLGLGGRLLGKRIRRGRMRAAGPGEAGGAGGLPEPAAEAALPRGAPGWSGRGGPEDAADGPGPGFPRRF